MVHIYMWILQEISKCRRRNVWLCCFFFLVNISHYRAGIGWTKRRLRERLGRENALASPLCAQYCFTASISLSIGEIRARAQCGCIFIKFPSIGVRSFQSSSYTYNLAVKMDYIAFSYDFMFLCVFMFFALYVLFASLSSCCWGSAFLLFWGLQGKLFSYVDCDYIM